MSAAEFNRAEMTKQTLRAVDLLDFVLGVLREEPATNDNQIEEIADRIGRARAHLVSVVSQQPEAISQSILCCSALLDDALHLAESAPRLPSRQEQSLRTIEQTRALLKPIIALCDTEIERSKTMPLSTNGGQAENRNQEREGRERRKHQRVALETEVTLQGTSNFYNGFTEDISCGGLFLSTYCLEPIGTKIDLAFTLPNGYVVRAPGRVRWLRDIRDPEDDTAPGMGIMFEDLKAEDKIEIEAFIKARSPIFYDDEL
ncbi:MAG: TIGR02266 family protein [Deltaproteobacteria bacterium]|nr:TIGR02266 family protein [Deltaproteobacteria bacterium]